MGEIGAVSEPGSTAHRAGGGAALCGCGESTEPGGVVRLPRSADPINASRWEGERGEKMEKGEAKRPGVKNKIIIKK